MSIALPRWRSTLHRVAARNSYPLCARRLYSNYVFQENDIVLVQKKSDPQASQFLSKPLRPGKSINSHTGPIPHETIIGLPPRSVVSPASGRGEYRIYKPTLGEYTNLTSRIVTPIYPADANLIVSLLDLHPTAPPSSPTTDPTPPLEIFEAGTGHGALTLHLARAIHAANPAPPPLPIAPHSTPGTDTDPALTEAHNAACEKWESYKPTRRAIITTLDASARHSAHAQQIVAGFRGGMYAHSVDFHAGSIPAYISSRLSSSPTARFDHAILDLPDCHQYLGILAEAVGGDGTIMVFCPSVTQIITCLELVKGDGLPLVLERTVEVGQGAGVGGRAWDVRAMRARAVVRAEEAKTEIASEDGEAVDGETAGEGTEQSAPKEVKKSIEPGGEGWNMVCRPKVGGRVVGGGFLGVFRRLAM